MSKEKLLNSNLFSPLTLDKAEIKSKGTLQSNINFVNSSILQTNCVPFISFYKPMVIISKNV